MPQLVVAVIRSFGTNFINGPSSTITFTTSFRCLDGVAGDIDHAGLHDLVLEQAKKLERDV